MRDRQCALNRDATESLSLSQMCHKRFAVLVEHRLVTDTDRQTDRQMDTGPCASTADA